MKNFSFRLERTRDFRKEQEDAQAKELAEARSELRDAERVRDDLEAVRSASRDRLRRTHVAGEAAGHLRNLEHVLEALDRRISEASSACSEAEGRVANSLEEYARARERRRMLDLLRDRRMAEWTREVRRAEQAQLDEIALTRFGRERAAGGDT